MSNITESHKFLMQSINNDRFATSYKAYSNGSIREIDFITQIKTLLYTNNMYVNAYNKQSAFGKTKFIMEMKKYFLSMAALGFRADGLFGQAYLIPFGNKLEFVLGYRGLIDLASRSNSMSSVMAYAVYENDEFELGRNLQESPLHRPALKNRGELIGAWATFQQLKAVDGVAFTTSVYDFMNIEEIDRIKSFSKNTSSPDAPWVKHKAEMAKKTVLKRTLKFSPLYDPSNKMGIAIEADNRAETDQPVDLFEELTGDNLESTNQNVDQSDIFPADRV